MDDGSYPLMRMAIHNTMLLKNKLTHGSNVSFKNREDRNYKYIAVYLIPEDE